MKPNNTEELYDKTWSAINDLSADYSPMAIAGVLVAQGLTIYRTLLSDSDYQSMVDAISDSRDKIQKLDLPEIQ